LEDARAHAVLIAGELADDDHHYVGFEVVVADWHGHERVRVAVFRPSD
jgi:hypothetical protein